MHVIANIDVDDLEKGIEFYRHAVGLRLQRRLFDNTVAEMAGASSVIYLLLKPAGSLAGAQAPMPRDYRRHWTPVHLDFVVGDIAAAVQRAVSAGARLEAEVQTELWGRVALMSDPFGHGFCFLQFSDEGYDAAE
jgi:predicted enzyme related to lactoylglutathione lyase